jgi:oxygen-dependent protoporphyrinogen oxidase
MSVPGNGNGTANGTAGQFLLEAGPESLLSRKTEIIDLCDALGISGRLIGTTRRTNGSFVSHDGKLYPVPQGFTGLVPGNTEAILSSDLLSDEAKQRFLQEPTIPPNHTTTDESLATFMTRRYGRELFERLIEPLSSGIYAGNPALLSMAATFPHLQTRERGRNADGRNADGTLVASESTSPAEPRRQADGTPYPVFVSFPNGMTELVDALRNALKRTVIETGTRLVSVQRHDANGLRYAAELDNEHYLDVDALLLSVPAYEAAPLLSGLDPVIAEALRQIQYASTVVVHLAYRSDDIGGRLDGHGYVVPAVEADTFLACTWSSSKWEGRAPDGHTLVRLYAGRYGRDGAIRLPDEELVARAGTELFRTVGIEASPVGSRVYRWMRGMPQYNLGHRERVDRIRERERALPGIYLAGAAYGGVGIPDCVRSARDAVRVVSEYLR